jgi:DNA-3-methyladenine glycosylase II
MPRYARGFDAREAHDHLSRRDRKLATWMKRIGPIGPDPRWKKRFDPVDALARAILYQQLSGKAAATIVGRVEVAIGSDRFHHDTLARCDDATIRACGVSGNKLLALRDLALRESRGEIPDLRRMSTMDNDAIIAALVPVRGIGRWTVEMMLMFRLARRRAAGRRPGHPQGRAARRSAGRDARTEGARRARRTLGAVSHLRELLPLAHRRFRRAGEDADEAFAGLNAFPRSIACPNVR